MNIYTIILYLLIAAIFMWRIRKAYRIGFVGELSNAVSIVIAVIIGFIFKNMIVSFMAAKYGRIIAFLSLLGIICAIHRILKLIFASLKIFSVLPVIKLINKLMGAALGFGEGIVIVYLLVNLLRDFIE